MANGLDKLIAEKETYNKESQSFIESLAFVDQEIGSINTMKQTEGWKILDRKIRDELQTRILLLVKDDLNIQTLLALLKVADTKSQSLTLEDEIAKILPT